MKIEFECPTCRAGNIFAEVLVPLRGEDVAHEAVCPAGHVHRFRIQLVRFQILAEAALQALVHGYYRDAVSTFSSSLERYMEFYVRIVAKKEGVKLREIDQAWKAVDQQSERQLGMYNAFYLLQNKTRAPSLDVKMHGQVGSTTFVKFRNSVVHKGYIPTEDEAMIFGEKIVAMIREGLGEFAHDEYLPAIANYIIESARRLRRQGGPPTLELARMCIVNIWPAAFEPAEPTLHHEVWRRRVMAGYTDAAYVPPAR